MQTIEPAPHEFSANLLFDSLDPFFACDRIIKQYDGSREESFTSEGDHWKVRLSYQDSNLLPPTGETTPHGREFNLDQIREYRLKVMRSPEQDEHGQQSFTFHLAPRWPGIQGEKENGSRVNINSPDGFEGVNIRVQGSNIKFDRYLSLLQDAAVSVGLNPRRLQEPHEYSNVQDAERYVRLHTDKSGPVHARDGPLAAMGHLLETDRDGYRKTVQNDQDEYGDTTPGYYHTVTLGLSRVREVFPTHSTPKEIKHYYAREANNLAKSNPLAHPKLGVSLQSSRLPRGESVSWDNLDSLQKELDETLLSVIADCLDVAPEGSGPFKSGGYFEPEVSPAGPDPVKLSLSRVKSDQKSVVVKHLADGLSPVQWESLETLVTDGGEVSPADIAASNDRHTESVRRALRDMEDLVHRGYAKVELSSDYIGEMVHQAVKEARDSTRRAAETAGRALDAAERGLSEQMSEFVAWASRHGADVDGRSVEDDLEITVPNHVGRRRAASIDVFLRSGLRRWLSAGLSEQDFREATVRFTDDRPDGTVWRFLKTR